MDNILCILPIQHSPDAIGCLGNLSGTAGLVWRVSVREMLLGPSENDRGYTRWVEVIFFVMLVEFGLAARDE